MLLIFGLNDVKKLFKDLSQNLRKIAYKNMDIELKKEN